MLNSPMRSLAIVTRSTTRSHFGARIVAAIALLATAAADAAGQRARGLPDPPRVAGMAPPPPAPPQPPAGQFTGMPHRQVPVTVAQPIAIGLVPVLVLSDGRVFADFGLGYEPVLRSCVVQGVIATPTPPARYETPVYSAPTYSTAAPPAASASVTAPNGATLSTAPRSHAATAACWAHNAGRVVVIR